ncbi:cyclin G [Episyrphus balteatus]|uniref:cyclin G n=1 Tax=Episyrphus balteatus TaxID=286459 RepID=UPI0024863C5A|nr:cyclin G [Episyrphus balteatus]XP_055850914.1 cyclin G [Episyrphus balteatus]XP_055850915.1 cyclin G [Episyrphus balteatus]
MSVPVRYSAAANFAVVDSGLSLNLQQEEQYHEQQLYHQQLQQQQLQQQQQFLAHNNYNGCNSEEEFRYHQQQYHQQQLLMQQQKQQQSSMMSLSTNQCSVPLNAASSSNIDYQDDMMMSTSPTDSEVSAAAAAINGSFSGDDDEWMLPHGGGRLGRPGAAEVNYHNENLLVDHHKQLQQNLPIGPSLTDNEKKNNNGKKSTSSSSSASLPSTSKSSPSSSSSSTASASSTSKIQQEQREILENELHAMTSEELFNALKEYDALQDKYHTVLLLPKESRREVTAGGRDGSAYVLRCLKMWYELPSDALFSAMSLVDRFLDRMAVKPKHMACMSVASLHLAIKQLGLKPIPAEDLVTISQCGCTAGDLERMAGVIGNKLGVQMDHPPITAVNFLRLYYALFRNMAKELSPEFFNFFTQFIKLQELENRLENLLCDVKTTVITPSTLALVLLCLHLDFHIKESYTKGSPELKHVFEYILFLQQFMRIPDRVFTCGFSIVSGILSHYNGQNKQPYKQRLVWKLSSRTLRVLRPTNRFSSDLPTIEEGISNNIDDGCRSRTESTSSEEEEDWPTSPIIPIFEQC